MITQKWGQFSWKLQDAAAETGPLVTPVLTQSSALQGVQAGVTRRVTQLMVLAAIPQVATRGESLVCI